MSQSYGSAARWPSSLTHAMAGSCGTLRQVRQWLCWLRETPGPRGRRPNRPLLELAGSDLDGDDPGRVPEEIVGDAKCGSGVVEQHHLVDARTC